MIRIAVVEDEKAQVNLLLDYLKRYFSEEKKDYVADVYYNGMELLKNYINKYDILLLDIEMPLLDGLETARKLRKIDPAVVIIFVTNMAQFAVKGYEVDAIGYLVKPYTFFSFGMNLKKALNHLISRTAIDVIITTRQGIRVIPSSDLIYIEVKKHELIYYTETEAITNRGTLKDIEEQLDKVYFARCNSCYLVNLKYVRSVTNNEVILPKGELVLSRGKKKEFMDKFMKYLGGNKIHVK